MKKFKGTFRDFKLNPTATVWPAKHAVSRVPVNFILISDMLAPFLADWQWLHCESLCSPRLRQSKQFPLFNWEKLSSTLWKSYSPTKPCSCSPYARPRTSTSPLNPTSRVNPSQKPLLLSRKSSSYTACYKIFSIQYFSMACGQQCLASWPRILGEAL